MHLLSLVISALLFGMVPMAEDDTPSGTFDTKFEVVTDNCKGQGIALSDAPVTVTQNGKLLNVKIPELPTLVGRTGRKGKLRAEAKASTKTPGLSARFGLNGRVSADDLQGVFVAEYFRGDKPECTQSFSLTGKRK